MKNVITAMGEQKLNCELKKYDEINIICSDIQYKEGIIEVLEQKTNIDYLIFNEEIQGQIEFEELINTIKLINKNIKVIIILEKENEEKIEFLKNKNINKIILKREYNFEKIINYIFENDKNVNYEFIKNRIEKNKMINKYEKIKKENFKNNIIKMKNKKRNNFFNKIKNIFKNKKVIKKIITISGTGGVGKSIFTANLANAYAKDKNKILIIDFDVINSSLHTLYGVNKYPEEIKLNLNNDNFLYELKNNKLNIKKLIIKINNKIDLISGINIILNNKKINLNEIYLILEELKKEYNLILIDTSTECFLDYTKLIMKCSDENIFLLEGNLLQVKKSIILLNKITDDWEIEKHKINLVINKKAEESIDEKVLRNIFSDFYIIGKIKYSKIYNTLINKNMHNIYFTNQIKREYKKISQEILKNNNIYKFELQKKTS